MSQLHNEGLRKQLVADKRTAITADWSWLVSFEPLTRPITLLQISNFTAILLNWLFLYPSSIT